MKKFLLVHGDGGDSIEPIEVHRVKNLSLARQKLLSEEFELIAVSAESSQDCDKIISKLKSSIHHVTKVIESITTVAETRDDSLPLSLEIREMVRKIAPFNTTVLITGESGTGKEVVARTIHQCSKRSNKKFVAVNCAALPESLFESELFGYKKGAFTDALRDKIGLFEEADGGTLFLDEIAELPLAAQVKLLRVLQERRIRPLGSDEEKQIDVRIITATLRNLDEEVRVGRFREDLFYRLNVFPLLLKPLRQRREEVGPLLTHCMNQASLRHAVPSKTFSSEVLYLLSSYAWPGNIRELENVVERALLLSRNPQIEIHDLPLRLRESSLTEEIRAGENSEELSIKKRVGQLEKHLISKALTVTQGNRTHASKILEISHRALLYKLKEYKICD
jgi:two-component system, NtrC family, response regulator AtoC